MGGMSRADDIQAIPLQIYRCCRAMDRMDVELRYSIWHEDGEADYGVSIFQGSGRDFVDWVTKSHAACISHSHQVTSIIVDLRGDHAVSESYVTAALRIKDGDDLNELTTRGRYLDRWSFRDGRWPIEKRSHVHDFDEIRRIEITSIPIESSRDRSDPSYTLFDGGN